MTRKCVVLGILWLIPFSLEAAKIKVHFTDNDNKSLGEVQAKVVGSQSKEEPPKTANKKGELSFEKLSPGDYQVLAQKSGYIPTKSEMIKVEGSDVDVTLKLVSTEYFNKLDEEGKAALQKQDYKGALARYQEMLALNPDNAMIWSHIARANAMLNDWDKALGAAQKAATLDPGQFENFAKQLQTWSVYTKGQEYLEQKNFPKAVEAFSKVVESDPNNAEAFYGLALAYGHQKKFVEAMKNIDQAVKLKPTDAEFLNVQKIIKHNLDASGQK